jgi:hypothetical protein
MVQSILDKTINYKEIKTMAESDKDFDAVIYDVIIDGKSRTFAIGQAQYSESKKNIIYFPIYLIINGLVKDRIGVYEIFENEIMELNIYDEDDDIIIEKLRKPLYFSNLSTLLKELDIKEKEKKEQKEEQAEIAKQAEMVEEDGVGDEVEDGVEDEGEEGEEESDEEREKEMFWIQDGLKDQNFKLVDNEGDGNCLFAVIRDALNTQKDNPIIQKMRKLFPYELTEDEKRNKTIDINNLRELVSREATEEIFLNYKAVYNALFEEGNELIKLSKLKISELEEKLQLMLYRNKKIVELFKNSKDTEERDKLRKEDQEIKADYKKLLEEKKIEKVNLKELEATDEDIEIMHLKSLKDIDNLEQFKKYIKTCDFWGESWAIFILERILNIKLILLSQIEYEKIKHDKKYNVEQLIYCGDETDPALVKQGFFNPTHYILVDHNGTHYQLITYKDQALFTFSQLPKIIKNAIKTKCYPDEGGSYYLIEELRIYDPKQSMGGKRAIRGTKKKELNQIKELKGSNKLRKRATQKKK